MSNKGLLTIILVILVGIFAVVAIDATQKSPEEEMVDDFGNLTETIRDKVENAG